MVAIPWKDLKQAASEGGFTALPANEYDTYVHKAEAGKTSTGKDRIRTQFRVENGPHAGSSVFQDFVISPENQNALGFFFRHMGALGFNDAYFGMNPALEKLASDMEGRRCRVRVSIRQWQGSDRNNVDAVLPPANGAVTVAAADSAPAAPLPPGGVQHFAPAPSAAPASPAAPAAPAPPITPPELPF